MYITYMDRDQDGSGSTPYILPYDYDRSVGQYIFEPYAYGATICIFSETENFYGGTQFAAMGKFNPHRCNGSYPSRFYQDTHFVYPPTGTVNTIAIHDGVPLG